MICPPGSPENCNHHGQAIYCRACHAQYGPSASPEAVSGPKTGKEVQRGGVKRFQAVGRLKSGEMNKTEARYQAEILEPRKQAGEIAWYRFEGITLKLAPDTRYTPDFFVMLANGELEAHEVKGFFTDDAKVKTKIAADMFPIRFFIIKARTKKDGGGWEIKEV